MTGDPLPGDRFTLPRAYVAPEHRAPPLLARLVPHHVRMIGVPAAG